MGAPAVPDATGTTGSPSDRPPSAQCRRPRHDWKPLRSCAGALQRYSPRCCRRLTERRRCLSREAAATTDAANSPRHRRVVGVAFIHLSPAAIAYLGRRRTIPCAESLSDPTPSAGSVARRLMREAYVGRVRLTDRCDCSGFASAPHPRVDVRAWRALRGFATPRHIRHSGRTRSAT